MYAVVKPGSMTRRSECITARTVFACTGVDKASVIESANDGKKADNATFRMINPPCCRKANTNSVPLEAIRGSPPAADVLGRIGHRLIFSEASSPERQPLAPPSASRQARFWLVRLFQNAGLAR